MTPKYRSTRGAVTGATFEEVVMGGLAPDKGLYVPESVPLFSPAEIEKMRDLSFADMAFEIFSKFVAPSDIPPADLRRLLTQAYGPKSNFRKTEVAPVVNIGGAQILELFHGPTLAFKDVALQLLGLLFEYFLDRRHKKGETDAHLTILGATSGDTGSAAIAGLRGKANLECFMLYPNGRVSMLQERQMATVPDENIHCIAIEGTFDDAQAIVKASFADTKFNPEVSLGAVNSINWARVLAQITYYFHSYFQVTAKGSKEKLNFSVPTGNFGDILAGYYAKRLGLPVGKLVVATNENDILHRFFTNGKYHKTTCLATLSPSMDISVSSNFERYLFHLCDNDPKVLKGWMDGFERDGKLTLDGPLLAKAQQEFGSYSCHKPEALKVIEHYNTKHGYLLCPHSAIGVAAADNAKGVSGTTIILATAHAGKFPEAIKQVIDPVPPPPPELAVLLGLPMRRTFLPNDVEAIKKHLRASLAGKSAGAGLFWKVAATVAAVAVAYAFVSRRQSS